MSEINFSKERSKNCENLMDPEIRSLLNLSLEEKIIKSLEIAKEGMAKYKKIGMGFSGGTDSLVMLHMLKDILPQDAPIIFVDTQHEFPETYEFVDKVSREWNIRNFLKVKAEEDKLQAFIDQYGLRTKEFTANCCGYHKISPMIKAIGSLGLEAFFVGLRGVEHEERAKETFFSPRTDPKHVRIHPLLFWRETDIMDYVRKFNIECNPIYSK
jgi:3'-phosphoadenosine 5'-phosphosulfate sulfotransferase (PAPS reductase)/FAD synthetase